MSIKISGPQRDALYGLVLDRLSAIGDIWLKVAAENYESAARLAQDYVDDLNLLLNDLGWGAQTDRSIELTTPPDVLRRVFSRFREAAAKQRLSEGPEWVEAHRWEERNRLVSEACEAVLAGLTAQS